MDERQADLSACQRRQREVNPFDNILPQGFHMVGWREHQVLIAEGHYRCPDCCRADTMEMNTARFPRR